MQTAYPCMAGTRFSSNMACVLVHIASSVCLRWQYACVGSKKAVDLQRWDIAEQALVYNQLSSWIPNLERST